MAFLVHDSGLWDAFRVTFDLTGAPRFPMVRLSVAVATVLVASPHLARPTRRFGEGLVALLALSSLYLSRGFPTDLIAAIVLGWGVAHAVEYLFGTPGRATIGRRRSTAALHAARHRRDRRAPHERATRRSRGVRRRRTDGPAPVRVVALGRDEADAQLLRTRVALRRVPRRAAVAGPEPARRRWSTRRTSACWRATRASTRRASSSPATHGALALLVVEQVTGTELYDLDADALSDALLDRIWAELRTLHTARVAHGKLDGKHVLIDGTTPRIVGFDFASSSARFRQTAGDVAQLLAATDGDRRRRARGGGRGAGHGQGDGRRRAPDAAGTGALGLDPRRLRRARPARRPPRRAPARSGAAATGTEAPELRRLFRVQPRSLLMAVGALVAVGVLLSRVGDPDVFWDTVKDADWWFVLLAFVLGIGTDVAFGITFLGNVPIRLPVWPSIELQSAMSFSNLAVPVAADTAMQVRFLQKNGLDLSSAVAAGGILSSVSEIIVQVGLLFVAIWLAPDSIDFGRIDTNQIVVVVLIAVLLDRRGDGT